MKKYIKFSFIFILLSSIIANSIFANYHDTSYNDAIIVDSLYNALPQENDILEQIRILNDIAWQVAPTNYGKSIMFADSAYKLSLKNNWLVGEAEALNNKGEAQRYKGLLEESLKNHQKALKIFEELGQKKEIAKTLSNIGISYFNLSDFTNSFQYFNSSLKIYLAIEDKDGILNINSYLGILFSSFKKYDKAAEFFQNSLNLALEMDMKEKIAMQRGNLGLAFMELKKYDVAKDNFESALKIFKENEDLFNYSIFLGNLGLVHSKLNNYETAISYFLESLEYAEEIDDLFGIAHQHGNLGELKLNLARNNKTKIIDNGRGKYLSEAVKHLNKSINIFEDLGVLDNQKKYLFILSEVYDEYGQYKKSLNTFKSAQALKDTLFSNENKKTIANLEIKQELDLKEKEVELLNHKSEYQSTVTSGLFIIASLILFITLVILYFLKKKQKDNEVLQSNIKIRREIEESLRRNELELKKHQNHLEKLVRDRTKSLELEILEHKETEEALLDAIERTEIANNSKTIFLANMSHELRTPLVGILGYSDLLSSTLEDEDAQEMAEGINRTGNRLLSTLSLILDLARIESDKFEIEIAEVEIIKELKETYKNFKAMAEKKNLKLNLNVHANEFMHITDVSMLKVILDNLINNAIKFTKKGEVSLSSNVEYEEGNSNLVIVVEDTGVGIAKKDIPLIFEEFKQLSEGFTKDFQGSGLGLSITKKFIELLGGSIKVESEPGVGSKFTIKLPAKIKAVA